MKITVKDKEYEHLAVVVENVSRNTPIIGWWSGGVTSAVAIKQVIDKHGKDCVRVIFIDTNNEEEDTYRFLEDCKKWYGIDIETIKSEKFNSIQEVWIKYKSLNVANGAVCSDQLKRQVRYRWEKDNAGKYSYQIFGFDLSEHRRALSMLMNANERLQPIFPLIENNITKEQCIRILHKNAIDVPRAYKYGLNNNNCLQTGCVQGGVGYWQKIREEFPDKFKAMAEMEHYLTELKGQPVTMLRKKVNGEMVKMFLAPHQDYLDLPNFTEQKGRPPKNLMECNGMCYTDDLNTKDDDVLELNLED